MIHIICRQNTCKHAHEIADINLKTLNDLNTDFLCHMCGQPLIDNYRKVDAYEINLPEKERENQDNIHYINIIPVATKAIVENELAFDIIPVNSPYDVKHGDTLVLEEFNGHTHTHRYIIATVSYVKTHGIEEGFIAVGFIIDRHNYYRKEKWIGE